MDNKKKAPHMVGLKEAAELTGLSYYALRKACLAGQVVCVRFAGKFFVNMDKLSEMLNGEMNDAEKNV